MRRLHVLLLRALDQLREVAQQGLTSPPFPFIPALGSAFLQLVSRKCSFNFEQGLGFGADGLGFGVHGLRFKLYPATRIHRASPRRYRISPRMVLTWRFVVLVNKGKHNVTVATVIALLILLLRCVWGLYTGRV